MSQYRRSTRIWPPCGTGCHPQNTCAPNCRPAGEPRPPHRPCYPPRPPLPPVWSGSCRHGSRIKWLAWALLAAGALLVAPCLPPCFWPFALGVALLVVGLIALCRRP